MKRGGGGGTEDPGIEALLGICFCDFPLLEQISNLLADPEVVVGVGVGMGRCRPRPIALLKVAPYTASTVLLPMLSNYTKVPKLCKVYVHIIAKR